MATIINDVLDDKKLLTTTHRGARIYKHLAFMIGAVFILAGFYGIYVNTYASEIAFNNGAGLHFIYLTDYLYVTGTLMVVAGFFSIISPLRFKFIALVIGALIIAANIGIAEYKIHKYGYTVPNMRVFAHKFMNTVPPIANHDGHHVKDTSAESLQNLEAQFNQALTEVQKQMEDATRNGIDKEKIRKMLVKEYYEPSK